MNTNERIKIPTATDSKFLTRKNIERRIANVQKQIDEYNDDVDHWNSIHPEEKPIPHLTWDEIQALTEAKIKEAANGRE